MCMNKKHLYILIVIFLFFACTKQVTKHPETISVSPAQQESKPPSFTKKSKKDTLTYCIEFHDSVERRHFGVSLEKLIKNFPSAAPFDSNTALYVKTQVINAPKAFSDTLRPQPFVTNPPKPGDSLSSEKHDTLPPRFGGSAILYSPQGAIDRTLSRLVEAFPFDKKTCCGGGEGDDSANRYCRIREASDKKIVIELSPLARNAAGKPFSAFEVVTGWNNYVKQHPGEGRALFRYVVGLDQFINGKEAVIMGFQVNDDKTITLQLSQPDHFAIQRLRTPRLFPASFKAGAYYVKTENAASRQLAPNVNYPGGRPYLNSCEIRFGKDNNPFLSFSLKRYDAMTLFSLKDLDYARRTASDKSGIMVFSEDRYFIAVALQSPQIREFLRRIIDAKDMLANSIKAEGRPLVAIESEADTNSGPKQRDAAQQTLAGAPAAAAFAAPLTILLCNEDPLSLIIADKLLSDLSRVGLACSLKSAPKEEYEKSLVKKDYGCAIGSVPSSVLCDPSERLRMNTLWFNDETSETARIQAQGEIPLFSIKTYLLYSNKIGLYNDAVTGIFRREAH